MPEQAGRELTALAKGHKGNTAGKIPPMPVDCREALQWFVGNFGLYSGSVRGLFLSDFSEEHQASLEASIINLKSRGFNPLTLTGDLLNKQAEYLWDQAVTTTSFGRPLATKAELDISGADLVILEGIVAPENHKQLWYFHNHVIYPRALAGKATIITTPLAYGEFSRYGASCPDPAFHGRPITWEKTMWLIEASMVNLELFRTMREESMPPMLKAEYYLYTSLKERGLPVVPQHVLGDYLLDLALIDKEQRLDIECDGVSPVAGYGRQAEDAKRNLLLLTDGWRILRFTTAEILANHAACADVAEEVWRTGRKKQSLGRLLTGQTIAPMPELPVDDELQQSAITHGGGPAAVVGGAGTGKTSCIIHRVAYLISQGVSPESILILSNSIDTVKTIKAGLDQQIDKQANLRVQLYAWHDFGFKILKENLAAIKRKAPLKVETNPQKVLLRVLEKYKKDLDANTLELSTGLDEFTLSALIQIYKANLVSPRQVKEQARDDMGQLVSRVYQAYEEQLQRANRIDREDMVTLAVQALLDKQELRAKYQHSYEFVLVDEYQDVTPAENALVSLLAAPQDNIYLAGDEDEAIYGSKGATPSLLMDVSLRMPQARCYVLEKNWRSHPAIVDHARQLLAGLPSRRMNKDMVPAWASPATGAIVGPHMLDSEEAEAIWVADEIQLLVDSGRKLRDIAVLYRYHHYGPIIEDRLLRRGVRCMASHPNAGLVPDEVEDILSFLRLVMDPDGPRAKESFERACQLRTREIDPKLWTTIASFAEANNLSFLKAVEIYSEATADQSCKDLVALVRLIRTMYQEKLPPAETISLIRRTQRLSEYYQAVSVPPGISYEPLKKLTQLEEEARKFGTVAEFVKHQNALRQPASAGPGTADPGVFVLTLHEAKGLEFPVVFMVGMAEGLFPSESAADLDEERRLCYVGFTRARELLYLSYPGQFNGVALQPSSFLVEARLLPGPAPLSGQAASAYPRAEPAYAQPPPAVPAASPPVQPAPAAAASAIPPGQAAAAQSAPQTAAAPPQPALRPQPQPAPAAGTVQQRLAPMTGQPPAAPQRPAAAPPRRAPSTPPAQPAVPQPPAPGAAPPAEPAPPAVTSQAPAARLPQGSPPPAAPEPAPVSGAQPPPAPPQPAQQPAVYPGQPSYYGGNGQPAPRASGGVAEQAPQAAAMPPQMMPGGAAPAAQPPSYTEPRQPELPQCPNCHMALEAQARFCGECGFHLGTRIPACPLCSAPLEQAAKFCGECGNKVIPAAFSQPLSPAGLPGSGRPARTTQHGWLVKFLKLLEQ